VQVSAQIMGTKSIPVTYEYTGAVKEGYQVESVKCLPESIEIKGSKDALNGIDELKIPSNALDLSKSVSNVEKSVSITGLLPEGVELVDGDNNNVIIKAEIVSRKARNFKVAVEDIAITNLPEGYEIDFLQKSVTVTITGERAAIDKVKAADIKLSLNIAGQHTGRFEKMPVVEDIDGVSEIKVTSVLGRVVKSESEAEEDEEE
jgi:YbbR domain-containing protein